MLSINNIGRINTRKAKMQFELKDNVDTRTNGCKLAMNKFRQEISRSFTTGGVRWWSNLIQGLRSKIVQRNVLN